MHSRHIPPEILSEIFLQCLDFTSWSDRDEPMLCSPDDAPHLLTQVCCSWRTVAMSTPRLWSTLSLPDVPITSEQCECLYAQVQVWLSLSRSLPLSFTLRMNDEDTVALHRYVSLLQTEIHRWKVARFEVSRNAIRSFPVFEPGSTPLLEEFCLNGIVNTDGEGVPTVMTALASAPRLYELELHHNKTYHWALPWASLTTLNIFDYTSDFKTECLAHFCEMLGACPSLESLSFGVSTSTSGLLLPPTSRVVLPRLDSFKVPNSHVRTIVSLMHTLVAPRLDALSLSRSVFDPEFPRAVVGESIRIFLASSGAVLEDLHLCGVRILPADLVRCLALLPSLNYLDVWQEEPVDARVFAALTLNFDQNGRLRSGMNPRLRTITMLPTYESFNENIDILNIIPVPPFSLRRVDRNAGDDSHGTSDRITFTGPPVPKENGLSATQMHKWFANFGSPVFSAAFARMVTSRWALPPNANASRLEALMLVHFDLHILERAMPEQFREVVKCWAEGLKLSVWCSRRREEYWREVTGNA